MKYGDKKRRHHALVLNSLPRIRTILSSIQQPIVAMSIISGVITKNSVAWSFTNIPQHTVLPIVMIPTEAMCLFLHPFLPNKEEMMDQCRDMRR